VSASMRQVLIFIVSFLAVSSGCGKSAPAVFVEAEALEGQGKLEDAAAKFELTCAHAPESDQCRAADGRAAEARIKAAEKAIGDGDPALAERLFTRALLTADDATAKKVIDRLASDEVAQGLAYQRALGHADRKDIAAAMTGIAATTTPAAARAKAWLDKERPGIVIAAVKAACGPAREGSCSKAAAELKAAAPAGPEADEATALAENEERRIYPDRVKAEALLRSFATMAARDRVIGFCNNVIRVIGLEAINRCGDANVPEPSVAVRDELRHQRVFNELTWRRTLRSIGDPALVAPLEQRKEKAIRECSSKGDVGALSCEIEGLTIPKPTPAPKQAPKK
jgi:hypothetical protein